MTKKEFQSSKPHLIVGTLGHYNHGKTTLTAALLKLLSRQNLAKAIDYADLAKGGTLLSTTKLSTTYVDYTTHKRQYIHIDCPSLPDTDSSRQVYDGILEMDAAILVIDVTKGIEAQTREHVIFARQSNITRFVVFLNKCDEGTDPEQLDFLSQDIRELLNNYHFDGDNTAVICGAALPALQGDPKWEKKLTALLDALDAIPQPQLNTNRPFLMTISNTYSLPGRGTVASGKIQYGRISTGEEIEVIGIQNTNKMAISGIEVFRKQQIDQAQAGDIIGCLLKGISLEDIRQAQVLASVSTAKAHLQFTASLYVLTKEEGGRHTPFFMGYRPQFFISGANVIGQIEFPEGMKMAILGESYENIMIHLTQPVYMQESVSFIIREGNRTIGIGKIEKIIA